MILRVILGDSAYDIPPAFGQALFY